jgi:hypothetical protein
MKKFIQTIGLILLVFSAPSFVDAQSKDRPKYSAPSTKPSPTPSVQPNKPKYTAPSTTKTEQPKYTAPNVGTTQNSSKPASSGVSEKARAAKEAQSERKFVETHKAVEPPKAKYTTPDGKDVSVRTATRDAEVIRNMPSTNLKPEVRRQNTTVHITQNHYHHDYGWYHSQPVVYVGGGYSSAFWWMMAEWDADRRARWLYNHRYTIEESAYQQGMRDAQVAASLNRLENQRAYRDPNYIDSEFRNDPSLQYTDEYVHAVYNPPVHHETDPGAALEVFLWLGAIVLLGVICYGLYVLCFKMRLGS